MHRLLAISNKRMRSIAQITQTLNGHYITKILIQFQGDFEIFLLQKGLISFEEKTN